MDWDTFLVFFQPILFVGLTIYGRIVLPKNHSRKHGLAFVALGLSAAIVSGWAGYRGTVAKREAAQQLQNLTKKIDDLQKNIQSASEAQRLDAGGRKVIREHLGELLREGNKIRLSGLDDARRKRWEHQVETYLKGNLDPSYLNRFRATEDPTGNQYAVMSSELQMLNDFIVELK